MDDGEDYSAAVNLSGDDIVDLDTSAVNSTILNYYKQFGRKRDLEQFFSLSTAQSEIRDPTSLFWRRMKSQSDSDSGGKRSESPTEICRISIKCSVPDTGPSGSQDENPRSDSESPPIITEDVAADTSRHTDDESVKSDDNQSQKSADGTLDTSMNKPFSPTSSITSRRKLEWDSLADVGYANETDRKASASNLSTLERLALKQQYSNNDTMDPIIGPPTAHSTPQDEDDNKLKGKKYTKTTKIYRRDFDSVQVNMPHSSEMNPSQAINVNLTKHITFNVDKGGGVHVENVQEDVSVKPDKVSVAPEVPAQVTDKEIQTTLTKCQGKSSSSLELPKNDQLHGHSVPVLINLNSLRKRNRRKKLRIVRQKLRTKRKVKVDKEYLPVQEKSGEQVSEAESFEYMPGHIYNQNHMKVGPPKSSNAAGNKSSLESSGALTTDSSKGSKLSFTKDLENSINLLKVALHKRYDDSNLKQKLIKEIVQRLLKTNYKGDESTTDFLSGISFSSKKIGLSESNRTTTSTSDTNNTGDTAKVPRPKKSILRVDKFNPQTIASTSQSAPNLPSVLASEKPVTSNLKKRNISSTTESDVSSKEKNSSDTAFGKTSSEELYKKYIDALRREEAYKRHLRDKEVFLKQKLVSSDGALKMPTHVDVKSQNRLKALMKDLTRNNYNDGSGDASKLECGSNSNISFERNSNTRKQRSHSVYTLSSGTSEAHKNDDLRQNMHDNLSKIGDHYCCCPYHSRNSKILFTNSSVQVNLNKCGDEQNQRLTSRNIAHVVPDDKTGDVQYLCLCNKKAVAATDKCSCFNNRGIQSQNIPLSTVHINSTFHTNTDGKLPFPSTSKDTLDNIYDDMERISKSSQTNLPLLLRQKKCDKSLSSSSSKNFDPRRAENNHEKVMICEATRCIQTGISINPKISDPSLSDMKILNDHDCIELIGEKYREVSKSTIQTGTQRNISQLRLDKEFSDDGSATSERYDDDNERNKNCIKMKDHERFLGKGIQVNYDNLRRKDDIPKGEAIQDNFAIPIQGTNMTLMVSLGTNRDKPHGETLPNQLITRVVATDAIDAIDRGTSLMEECSKGVQSQNTNIFSEIERPITEFPLEIDHNSNDVKEPCMVNTLFTREGFFQSIYPDERQIAEQVPYVRSNANRRDLQKSCGIQTVSDNNIFSNASKETMSQGHLIEPYTKMTNKQKCVCPEMSKCANICREDAECLRQRPFLRSNTDTEVLAKHVTTAPRTTNPAYRSLQNNPFQSITTDTYDVDEVMSDKEIPIIIDTASTKNQLISPKVYDADAVCEKSKQTISSNTVTNKNLGKNISPRNVSALKDDQNTACVNPTPFIRSNTDTGNLGKNISPRNIYQSLPNRTKCKCPESSKCAGKCGENAECLTQKPCLESIVTDLDNLAETSNKFKNLTPRSTDAARVNNPTVFTGATNADYVKQKSSSKVSTRDTYQVEALKTSACNCPVPSKCGGMCRDDAPCLKRLDTDTHKDVSQDLKFNTLPKIDKSGNRRTLLRSNTDASNMDQDSCIEADNKLKKNDKLQSRKHADEYQSGKSGNETTVKSSDSQAQIETTDSAETGTSKDLVLEMIQDITKRYSKKDIPKSQRKKCFKEIMSILNYLLDTEESPDPDHVKSLVSTQGDDAECSTVKSKVKENICASCRRNRDNVKITESSSRCTECGNDTKQSQPSQVKGSTKNQTDSVLYSADPYHGSNCMCGKGSECVCRKKKYVDKGVQLSTQKSKTAKDCRTESSDNPVTSDMPFTSSDSATCKVLNKIKKECEKFHQKRCLSHGVKTCECSSSTSVNCDNCKRVHHCPCRGHKCRGYRSKTTVEKVKKKSVAYNLIIQTSESMISEENSGENCRPLQNIVVKVPPKRHCTNVPFKEMSAKIEERQARSPRKSRCQRSRSLPNESGLSSADENVRWTEMYTVREYLERNRPEFVEQCSKRQNCLKLINETRANERAANRKLLSMQVRLEKPATLNALSASDLRHLARELGLGAGFKRKTDAPKFISERNMKKHSEKIYKGLSEVTQKKEAAKKEGIKKTNLLMANIFRRNLQKKTLSGAVNLSNYSTVIKI